jgi:hypothetical protein
LAAYNCGAQQVAQKGEQNGRKPLSSWRAETQLVKPVPENDGPTDVEQNQNPTGERIVYGKEGIPCGQLKFGGVRGILNYYDANKTFNGSIFFCKLYLQKGRGKSNLQNTGHKLIIRPKNCTYNAVFGIHGQNVQQKEKGGHNAHSQATNNGENVPRRMNEFGARIVQRFLSGQFCEATKFFLLLFTNLIY